MLDIGWGEMLVIAVVVIVVVGPKELPGMLRTFGKTTSKLRVMANDFRRQFDEAMKEAELDDVKKIADDMRALNPKNEIRKALSPIEKAAQDVRAGLDAAMKPDTAAAPAAPAPQPAAAAEAPAPAAASPTVQAAAKPPTGPASPVKAKPAAKPKPAAATPAAAKAPAAKPRAAKAKTGGEVS